MTQTLKKTILAGFALFSLTLVATPALARAADPICEGIGLTSANGGCAEDSTQATVGGIIKTIVEILSIVVGVASVIMVIVGGFKYVTSNGDSGSVTSAKNTILYALVGLAVAALAQGLVRFVFNKVQPTNSSNNSSTPTTP